MKTKTGRPKLFKNIAKISLSLSEKEKKDFQEEAQKQGLSSSQYFRKLIQLSKQ